MKRERVFRALARFDVATANEIALVLGAGKRNVWAHLESIVRDGYATREGENHIRYAINEAGRELLKRAA